jgi:hypothetical protein
MEKRTMLAEREKGVLEVALIAFPKDCRCRDKNWSGQLRTEVIASQEGKCLVNGP